MKKRLIVLLTLLLALAMVFTACGPSGEEPVKTDAPEVTQGSDEPEKTEPPAPVGTDEPEPTEPPEDLGADLLTMTQEEALAQRADENVEPHGQIVIGDSSDTKGDFMSGWTNSSPDAQLKTMIHGGYDTVYFDPQGVMHINPVVVENIKVEKDADGNKTYTYKIYENLKYSDGEDITADDYVFSILLGSCWEFGVGPIGGSNIGGYRLVGYNEFHELPKALQDLKKGEEENIEYKYEKRVFAGVHKLGDYEFSITIDNEYLPYYYDLEIVAVGPQPLHVLAPGVEVKDDGEGAYLTEEFTVDLLEQTIIADGEGYRFKPTVSCGPYKFVSYDRATELRTIEANDQFLGMFDGKKPAIKTIVQKKVTDKTQAEELKTGSVDLLAPINGKDAIEGMLAVVEDDENLDYITFNRNGFGYLGFQCDTSPVQYKEVRHAIAHLLDRDAFLEQYAGPYARKVNGIYGLGQLEYQNRDVEISEQLNPYEFNPDKAVELLEACGFTLDESGNEYAGEGLRYKEITNEDELPPAGGPLDAMMVEVDGKKLMPLKINWMNTPDNPVSELIRTLLLPEAKQVGMEITDTTQDFKVLLAHFYRDDMTDDQVEYTMMNLATGFAKILSFWDDVNPDPEYMGFPNTNFIKDDKLYELAMEMYHTTPGDTETWYDRWLDFQVAYNDYLPMVPLYSDIYHVFYNVKLINYEQDVLWDYGDALPFADVVE